MEDGHGRSQHQNSLTLRSASRRPVIYLWWMAMMPCPCPSSCGHVLSCLFYWISMPRRTLGLGRAKQMAFLSWTTGPWAFLNGSWIMNHYVIWYMYIYIYMINMFFFFLVCIFIHRSTAKESDAIFCILFQSATCTGSVPPEQSKDLAWLQGQRTHCHSCAREAWGFSGEFDVVLRGYKSFFATRVPMSPLLGALWGLDPLAHL